MRKAQITLESCGSCPHRSAVYYSSGSDQHYSFCSEDRDIIAHGPPWEIPRKCPFIVKKGKKTS